MNAVLINHVAPKSTDSILDIGCGTGATTRDFAAHTQHAHGIDISTSMLAPAQKSTLQNTAFTRADAQTEPLSKLHYDHLVSRFGVMFFEDPFEAFKNIHNSLKQDGQLSFVCWQNASLNPWQSLSMQVIKQFLDLPAPPPKSPGPFAFEDKEYIKEILEASGFQEIGITDNQEEIVMFSGKSIREASEDYLTINPVVTEMLKNSGDELREEILEALITKFSDFHKNEGLLFPSATWIVSAKK